MDAVTKHGFILNGKKGIIYISNKTDNESRTNFKTINGVYLQPTCKVDIKDREYRISNHDSNGGKVNSRISNYTEYISHYMSGGKVKIMESNYTEYITHDSNGGKVKSRESNYAEYISQHSNGREAGSSESNCTEYSSHDSNGKETGSSESNCTEYRRNDSVCRNNEDSDPNNVYSDDAIKTDFQGGYETGVREPLQLQTE